MRQRFLSQEDNLTFLEPYNVSGIRWPRPLTEIPKDGVSQFVLEDRGRELTVAAEYEVSQGFIRGYFLVPENIPADYFDTVDAEGDYTMENLREAFRSSLKADPYGRLKSGFGEADGTFYGFLKLRRDWAEHDLELLKREREDSRYTEFEKALISVSRVLAAMRANNGAESSFGGCPYPTFAGHCDDLGLQAIEDAAVLGLY